MNRHIIQKTPVNALAAALGGVLFASQAIAGQGGHGAHVHGAAELTIAVEGSELAIALNSPAANIVGFERRAATSAERKAADEAQAKLRDASSLFTFSGASCALQSVELDLSSVQREEPTHSSEHDHGKSHDDDAHDHDGHHHGDTHTDISAQYNYTCTDSDKLQAITIGGEKLPFGLEKLNVQWVSDRAQGATTLTPGNQRITFNPA